MNGKEALLYTKNKDKSVDCFLCRHRCHIKENRRGICMVRENRGGKLFSLFYGKPIAVSIDPIEKKPLYHFYPGTESFSIATVGCNFQCSFCQNWDISQYGRIETGRTSSYELTPKVVAEKAHESGCKTIAYTYSEPTIFFEYALDIAIEAEKYGIKNVFVTNGFMTQETLKAFNHRLHAANVDLKAFNKDTYKNIMKGDLEGVLDSIIYMKKIGIWVEITTLIVPGMNDSREELSQIANFIAKVDKDIPWHISRFHPMYKETDKPATPLETLEMAYDLGKEAGLKYIYVGNVPSGDKENTFCHKCGQKLISRDGFYVRDNLITKDSKCIKCGAKIAGCF